MSLFHAGTMVSHPIEEGDAGVILRKNGEYQFFSTHDQIDPKNLTDRQYEQAMILQAFAVALKFPEVMEALAKMALDPKIAGVEPTVGVEPKQ